MDTSSSENITRLSNRQRRAKLPDHVVRLCTGGVPITLYENKDDVVAIRWCGTDYKLHIEDYELASRTANAIIDEWIEPQNMLAEVNSPSSILTMRSMAAKKLDNTRDTIGKRGICMLKDQSGSGWWRMVQPASYMNLEDWYIDITAAAIDFEQLLEYDVIYVQRVYEWEQYHTLKKLQDVGKRIVYDIDDDLFDIPMDNPASRIITRDNQYAAMACMQMADAVTTTSKVLRDKIVAGLDNPDKMVIIPNSLDTEEGWLPTPATGSPDDNLRIFWQGSATHAEDWEECIDALDLVMAEYPNLRMVILGFLPPVIRERINHPDWNNRIEYMGFSDPESYFEIIKHIRADVGLAPLRNVRFNHSKSPIKFVENSLIGVPTVASNTLPYSDVIENCVNGYLCSNTEEWTDSIRLLLNDASLRREMVRKSRSLVSEQFDIRKSAEKWQTVLTETT